MSSSGENLSSMDREMEIRVHTRRQSVQDYCKRHQRNDSIFGKDLRYHLVFHSKKIIYCFAPKIASSEWKRVLSVLNDDIETYSKIDEVKFDRLNHYSLKEAQEILGNYFTFLFVRHPLERFLSAYKDKFLRNNTVFHRAIGRKIIKRFRPNATKYALETGSGVTFPEFTNYVVETRHLDEHWRPLDSLCYPCGIEYDFIGHYEDLAQDAPYLVKKAGIDDRVTFPPFRTSSTTAELMHYFSQISKLRILELAKLYEGDFEMFGFPFPGQLEKLLSSSSS